MKQSNRILHFIAITLSIINSLFLYKYLSRVSHLAPVITIAYFVFFSSLPLLVKRINLRFIKVFSLIAFTLYILIVIAVYVKTDANDFRVDRASAIVNFWDSALKGIYPYSAETHIAGSYQFASPMLLVIAFPFYLLKELGILSLTGFLLLLLHLFRKYRDHSSRYIVLFVTLFSPMVAWELIVRSNLVMNMALMLLTMHFIDRKNLKAVSTSITSGILFGLLLSTRSVLAIPIALWYAHVYIRTRMFRQAIICGAVLTVTFGLTLAPFALWDFQQFTTHNPLLFQSSFMPLSFSLFFIVAAFFQGLFLQNHEAMYRQIGSNLLLCIGTYSVVKIVVYGFSTAYFDSAIDLSYYLIPYCFLLSAVPQSAETHLTAGATVRSSASEAVSRTHSE